jgi:hypothetical protein
MITVPAGIRVLVATKPVDFRRGADSLAALVREQLKHDPFGSVGADGAFLHNSFIINARATTLSRLQPSHGAKLFCCDRSAM